MTYKILIVDDEEPARDLLKSYAEKIETIEIFAVVNNALTAKQIIEKEEIDILLTDIQMDDLTGIDLVKTLKNPPITIFTTAYSEYALEGYKLDVADYLVKPISFAQFCQSMDKAMELIRYKKNYQTSIPQQLPTAKITNYFFVKTNRKMVKVSYAAILFIESYGEYVKIYTKDDVILALQRMSFMEEMLIGEDFIRIHRSHIINVGQISEIDGNTVVIDRHRLTVSKRMKEHFMELIGRKGII